MRALLAVLLLVSPLSAAPKKAAAPAIPEEARRAFVRGGAAFSEAQGPEDFARAAELFAEASKLAPKWPEPWFNLAKAREAGKDYAGALAALKSYIALPVSEADKRQAQDLSYALEEKASKKRSVAAAEAAMAPFIGRWSRTVMGGGNIPYKQWFDVSRDGSALKLGGQMFEGPRPPTKIEVSGGALRFDLYYVLHRSEGDIFVTAVADVAGALSADGRTMTFRQAFRPYTPAQETYWKDWPHGPGDAYGGVPWTADGR